MLHRPLVGWGVLGLLGAACTDPECVQNLGIGATRLWRGESPRSLDPAWTETDRYTVFEGQDGLDEVWAWFELESELGAAPLVEETSLPVLYRTEPSGSCVDHSQVRGFFLSQDPAYEDVLPLKTRLLRRDVCEPCSWSSGGFYELWDVAFARSWFDLAPDDPVPVESCVITGPCYENPE